MSEKGSKTEVAPLERHVRSTLKSRHRPANPACPFRAKGKHHPATERGTNKPYDMERMLTRAYNPACQQAL
jgi:hypothetical protein